MQMTNWVTQLPIQNLSTREQFLNRAELWANKFCLKFCDKKSVCVIFHKTMKLKTILEKHPIKPIYIGGKPVEFKKEAKYLGVIFDSKLSFKSHIEHQIQSCKVTMLILKSRVTASHGPIPELIRGVFRSIVISRMTYGCHLFYHKLTKRQIQKLSSLNRRGATAMASIFPGTGNGALEALLGIKPIHIQM